MTRRATGRFSKIRDGMHFSGCSFGADLREARCPGFLKQRIGGPPLPNQRKTVLCEYFLMLACGLSAVLILKHDLAISGLATWTIIYAILGYLVEKKSPTKCPLLKFTRTSSDNEKHRPNTICEKFPKYVLISG